MNSMSDIYTVWKTTKDESSRELLTPRIKRILNSQVRLLVWKRLKVGGMRNFDLLHRATADEHFPNDEYTLKLLQDEIAKAFPESIEIYKKICVLMEIPNDLVPEKIENATP